MAIVLAAGVMVAGCGGDEGGSITSDPAASKPKPESQSGGAGVGDAIDLETIDTEVSVTVAKVIDPVKGGPYDEPPAGTRFVGVELRIVNRGENTFGGSLFPAIEMVDDGDRVAQIATPSEGACAGAFATDVQIAPGDERAGCVAFSIDKSADPRLFQFSVDSGETEPNTAEWQLEG